MKLSAGQNIVFARGEPVNGKFTIGKHYTIKETYWLGDADKLKEHHEDNFCDITDDNGADIQFTDLAVYDYFDIA